jgi:hypothetical protein
MQTGDFTWRALLTLEDDILGRLVVRNLSLVKKTTCAQKVFCIGRSSEEKQTFHLATF